MRGTLAAEEQAAGDITLVLADDHLLRDLNRRYRGLDRATDVLSFAYDQAPTRQLRARAPRRARRIDGDVVVSLDRMRDQARRFRVTPGASWPGSSCTDAPPRGHDHHRPAERRRMRRREAALNAEHRAAIARLDRALAAQLTEARASARLRDHGENSEDDDGRSVMGHLRRYLLTGLIVLAPTAITLWVFFRLLNWVDNILGQYFRFAALDYHRLPESAWSPRSSCS